MLTIEVTDTALERALQDSLVKSLETMAFIFPSLLDELPGGSSQTLCRVRIGFGGDVCGEMELMSTPEFAVSLAVNLLGVSPTDPDIIPRAEDAMKEFANVTCGLTLRQFGGSFELSLPMMEMLAEAAWPQSSNALRPVLLEADGHPMAAFIRIHPGQRASQENP